MENRKRECCRKGPCCIPDVHCQATQLLTAAENVTVAAESTTSMGNDTISRREFFRLMTGAAVGAAGLGALATSCAGRPATKGDPSMGQKPNLLFIFADQLRPQSTGFGGERQTHTPNLDRFAIEGVNFTNAISNTPVCTPYRAVLLSGQYPHTNGTITNFIRLPDEARTVGKILKTEGYSTGYIGKWHLSGARGIEYEPPGAGRQGFDHWASFAFNHRHNKDVYYADGPEPVWAEGYQTDGETERAIKFIEHQNAEKPFCLFLSWGPPHPPYAAWNMPPRYLERYGTVKEIARTQLDENARKVWREWQKPVRFTPREMHGLANAGGNRINDFGMATYYAMTDWVDDCFGRIMAALERTGQADNTIVVFSSDHGEMLGSHDMRGKMVFYDESVRIPFLVRWPARIAPRTESDACISSVDFMPTLLGLLDVTVPDCVQGMDLSHCALGEKGPEPSGGIVASYTGYEGFTKGWEYRGIRTKRYTYARSLQELWMDYGPRKGKTYADEPQRFLFDNAADPGQTKNLARDAGTNEVAEELEAELHAHLERTGDGFHPAPYYKQFFDDKGRLVKPIR